LAGGRGLEAGGSASRAAKVLLAVGRFLAITLGVVTAIGGYLDMGELVSMPALGATYGFALLWALAVGTIGAMVFAEMAGRIELESKRTVQDLVRERLGLRLGLVTLCASVLLNLLTLVVEIAGLSFVLELVFGIDYIWFVPLVGIGVALFDVLGNWTVIEYVPSILGLAMLVVVVAVISSSAFHVDWSQVAARVVDPHNPKQDHWLYVGGVIAVVGAAMSPYEWYFYSSGGREEHWTVHDKVVNRSTAFLGFGLGALLAFSLMIGAAALLGPQGITPTHFGQTGLLAISAFGQLGAWILLVGMFGCVLGAAAEVSLSTAQAVAQFFGWPWGASRPARDVPGYSVVTLIMVTLATLILLGGFDPIKITVLALIFSAGLLPLTFYPMLIVANDPLYMGDSTNKLLSNGLGWLYFALLSLAGIAALPIVIVTGGAL
jgi:Mn2+/Fe2+ NRAMP family transporter